MCQIFFISPQNIKKEGGREMKAVSMLLALLVGVALAIHGSELEGSSYFFVFFFLFPRFFVAASHFERTGMCFSVTASSNPVKCSERL
jgi:hypothetical protein